MSFSSLRNKGFHITFPNKWTISVQFGPDNYCNDYWDNNLDFREPERQLKWTSPDAEVAIWHDHRSMFEPEGWQTPLQVADLIAILANDPAPYYNGA